MKRLRGPCPEATARFLAAARENNVAAVRDLLETTTADINATDPLYKGNTALMMACNDTTQGEALANLLLDYGASTNIFNIKRKTAFGYALQFAPLAIIKRLANVATCEDKTTWLRILAHRHRTYDDHAELLTMTDKSLWDGDEMANVISRVVRFASWPFLRALLCHPPASIMLKNTITVERLLEVISNRAPIDIVQLLASKCKFPENGQPCIIVCLSWNIDYARQLRYHVPELANRFIVAAKSVWLNVNSGRCSDPVGIMKLFDAETPTPTQIKQMITWEYPSADRLLWALVRTGICVGPIADTLALSTCPHRWQLLSSELDATKASKRLHTAIAKRNVATMLLALQHGANPFWRDNHGNNALFHARADQSLIPIYKALREAIRFRPERRIAHWYGPYFQHRAWAFLMCCLRFEQRFGRDVRLYIVGFLADLESV